MQHSVSPYTLRCFNSSYVDEQPKVFHDGTRSTHYMKTNNISGHDLFALLVKFLEEHSTYTAIDYENKMLYAINGLQADKSNRTISGYMHKGNWGVPAHIQDANGKREPYAMSHDQAPMIAHYFYFSFPQDEQAAICVFHNIGNHGIKTVFEEKFGAAFKAVLPQFTLQYNPMQYTEIYDKWKNAQIKRIRVNRFKRVEKDRADAINAAVGDNTHELVIKVEDGSSNKLVNFFTKDTPEKKMVELMEAEGSDVRGEFVLDGKRKTLKIGAARSAKCDILIEEDELSRENGQLKQPDFHNYIVKLVADIHSRIYR